MKICKNFGLKIMASPQLEKGYLKIANELAEALARNQFTGHENRVIWAVMRKTYGYNKKQDQISYGQLAAATGLSRKRVFEAVASLKRKGVLRTYKTGNRSPLTYAINKDYESWLTVPENRVSITVPENRDSISENHSHAGDEARLSRKTATDSPVPENRDNLSRKSGTDLSRFSGTTKDSKDNINTEEENPEKISREISSGPSPETRDDYLCKFENSNVRELVERVIDKLSLTRKSGKISESIVLRTLKSLVSFEDWKVGTGCMLYLDNEYYLDSKGESYFLGIVRNVSAKDYDRVIGGRHGKGPHDNGSKEFHWKNAKNVLKYDGEQRFLEYCRAHGLNPSEVPEWNTRNLPNQ